jgi:hypothetical protein
MRYLGADELAELVPHDITPLLGIDTLVLPPSNAFNLSSGTTSG